MTRDLDPKEFAELEAHFLEARRLAPHLRDDWLSRRLADRPRLLEHVRRLLDHDKTSETILREVGREAQRMFEASTQVPRIEGFDVLEILGRGGMSTVFAAEQHTPHRVVAIKVLEPHRDRQEHLARLIREADVLARLEHPNIARIIAVGRTLDDRPYLAMERVEGRRLDRFLAEENPSLDVRIELLLRVCAAIQHAHQRGVIHRDLKPSNILIDASGEPKVLDFGIAWLIEQPASAGSMAGSGSGSDRSGTLPYMSPEQLAGDTARIDTRSDVYGLGALAYEMFSGRPPYQLARLSTAEAIERIEAGPPPRLSRLDPRLRGDIEAIVARAMHREVESRYASAAAFAEDLSRHQKRLPVAARPQTSGYVLACFVRRNAAVSAAAAIAVLGVTAGLAMALFALEDVRRAEAIAHERATTATELGDRLTKLLTVADDSVLSAKVSFHDLLVLGRERLRNELPSSPRARAQLLVALGRAYLSVAENQQALELFEEAAQITATPAADANSSLEALLGRVRALVLLGRVDDARTVLADYESRDVPVPTPAAYILAVARFLQFEAEAGNLGNVVQKLEFMERLERDPRQGESAGLLRVAITYRRADLALREGRIDESGRLVAEATQQKLAALGTTTPLLLLELLGGTLALGPEATDRTQLRPERDRAKLGQQLQQQERWPELEAHSRETLRSIADEPTPRLDVRLPAMRQLALARYGQGHGDDALEIAGEMVEISSRRRGAKSLEATMARDLLAELAHGMNRHDLVIATCNEALEQLRGRSDRPRLQGKFLERKGLHLFALGKTEDAKAALEASRQMLDSLGMDVSVIDRALTEIAARHR